MVCSIGSGRMAVMARLLEARSFSQNVAGYVGKQKLAAKYIHKQICEADEPNLLDEEDMHVFGLKPMDDPLHLVCCSQCKKPIKASHYAAHAELCGYLSNIREDVPEVSCCTERRRPPRKERRKLLSVYPNEEALVRKQEEWVSRDAYDATTSDLHMDGQVEVISFLNNAKDMATVMTTDSGVCPASKDNLASVMPPSTKRSKLLAGEFLSFSDVTETAFCVARMISNQETHTSSDVRTHKISQSETHHDCATDHRNPGQVRDCNLQAQDIPVPLATKMYYSQTNNRLRSAVCHLYQAAATQGLQDISALGSSEQELMQQQESSHRSLLPGQNSDAHLTRSGGRQPASNFSNEFSINEDIRPEIASARLIGGRDSTTLS